MLPSISIYPEATNAIKPEKKISAFKANSSKEYKWFLGFPATDEGVREVPGGMASVCEMVIPSIFCRKNQKSHWWPDRRLAKGQSENLTHFRVKGNDHQEGWHVGTFLPLGHSCPQ